jgi:hypothetical protein
MVLVGYEKVMRKKWDCKAETCFFDKWGLKYKSVRSFKPDRVNVD